MNFILSRRLGHSFCPNYRCKNTKKNHRYRITMDNYYLNSMGKVYKIQNLKSIYTRTIKQVIRGALLFTSYEWDEIIFTNRLPKKPIKPVNWSFIKGKSFDSHVILSNEKLEQLCETYDVDISEKDYTNCFQSIENAYKDLPKLPSSYLVVMQTFDILAFENYWSYILTNAYSNRGWKIDQWVKIAPPEFDHDESAKIGLGFYSKDSYFKNRIMNFRLTGYTKINHKLCAVFDYYCDHSEVMTKEKDSENVKRTGTSFYHGQIWMDIKEGDILRGTMEENYIALQEGVKETPVNIKRRVLCELMEDG